MKILLFFLIITVFSFYSKAYGQYYRILSTSDELNQIVSSDSIKSIIASETTGNIKVQYKDGRRNKIKSSSIWGYMDNKNHIYRFFKGKIYKITSIENTVKYERVEQRYVGKPVYVGNFVVKYNSISLDDAIIKM